jgi:NADH:ubiquinone oxidoreductase subunit F (NADH-binding)
MKKPDIISKLKKANLLGRGGANFPTGTKWEMVKSAKAEKKYIICNGSEKEPNVFKDKFLLKNHAKDVMEGIKIALETIENSSAYIYLNKEYYEAFGPKLKKLAKNLPIKLFKKRGGYVAGEESVAIESIEGNRLEPRIKPPFPPQKGLWGYPTLVNNIETFYHVAKIAKNEYKKTRFYSISGDVKKEGVYEFPENYSISKILKASQNYPDFDFFVQNGGGATGEILLKKELNQPTGGTGAIIVFNKEKTSPTELMKKWAKFFLKESCGKCLPCREGVFHLSKIVNKDPIDNTTFEKILFNLEKASFCGLGKSIATPFRSLIKKIK